MDVIRSASNPAIKRARAVASGREADRILLEGDRLVDEAVARGLEVELCLVAEGRFDTMVTFRSSYEWDLAAGALIAEEAGARVTDGAGQPMLFNSPEAMQPGVMVAPAELHAQLMTYRLPQRQ